MSSYESLFRQACVGKIPMFFSSKEIFLSVTTSRKLSLLSREQNEIVQPKKTERWPSMMKKKPLSVFHALQREEAHCGATAAARVDGGCAEEVEAACTPQNLLSVDLAKPSISHSCIAFIRSSRVRNFLSLCPKIKVP